VLKSVKVWIGAGVKILPGIHIGDNTVVGAGAGTVNEPAPPAGARLKVIGCQGVAADIAAVIAPANRLTSTTLNWTTLGLAVGMWVKIGGTAAGTKFATATNNGWARISAITSTYIEFDSVPTGWVADAGTDGTIRTGSVGHYRHIG
jgi:hypothetical protein